MSIEEIAAEFDERDRFADVMKSGESVRQGDLYLHRVDDRDKLSQELGRWLGQPLSTGGSETSELQLVSGNTPGSRHCIAQADADVVSIFAPGQYASPLEGPRLVASGRFRVVHPEHATVSLPEGEYQITYQRDWGQEETRRVQD